MDGFSIKRIIRKPYLSIVSFIVAGAMCFLLCVLANYRREQTLSLERLEKEYEVRAVVTDVKGTKSNKLRIGEDYTDFITDETNGLGAYVDQLVLTKEFRAVDSGDKFVIGINDPRGDDALDRTIGGEYFSSVPEFFESDDYIAIIPKRDYDNRSSDEFNVTVLDPYSSYTSPMIEITLTIVGWHSGDDSKMFIPLPNARTIAQKISARHCSDSVMFVLNDNSKIDEVNEKAMKRFQKVDPGEVNPGFALTVRDQQYKATVASFRQNIARTGYLLPIISLLGLAAGFLSGFLGTKGETRNYALMRTMGLTGARLFLTVLFEQQILSLIACAIVAIITKRPVESAAFFACNTVGTLLAVLKPVFAPPTKLLRDQQ